MDTTFSHELRVVACDRCGAPLDASVGGGSFTCRFCHAHNQLAVRDEALMAPQRSPIPEHERVRRLRMQDGKPLLPPPSIQHLMPDGQLADWKVDEAVAVWNGTRQELRAARGNYEAAERLVFLTMVLSQHFQLKGDRRRQRSLLEGALDVVSLPRHRQIMRGYLCRAAVRAGDIQAAEAWLAPCDTGSDDLETDSAYRFSRAFVDTARGDFARVLQVLGQGPNDVPIEDAADEVCAVFRANAWEKLGRTDQAVMLLRQTLARGGGKGRMVVQRVIQLYGEWHLCAASYPQAASGHAHVAAGVAARRASGGIHVVFVPLGFLMFFGGLVALAVVGMSAAGVLDVDEHAWGGLGAMGGTFFVTGLIFLGIGLAMKKSAERAAWLRIHGLSGTGQVQSVSPTGLSINNVPQMEFTLVVELAGRAPYTARTKALMSGMAAAMAPGARVPVRVDPRQPQEILIEMD